jgi:hypothetical protein
MAFLNLHEIGDGSLYVSLYFWHVCFVFGIMNGLVVHMGEGGMGCIVV